MLRKWVLSLLLLVTYSAGAGGHPNWDTVEPITKDNVHQLMGLATSGNGTISDLEWSPDGHYLAAATPSGIELHTVDNSNTIPFLLPMDSPASIAFSPDGTLLAASGCVYGTRTWDSSCQGMVYLWNLETQEPIELFRSEQNLRKVAFSPDGQRLGVADPFHDTLHLFDVATTHETMALDVPFLLDFAFHPVDNQVVTGSGSVAYSGSESAGVQIWDTQTGERLVFQSAGEVSTVSFSGDGQSILFCLFGSRQAELHRWVLNTDEFLSVIDDEAILPDWLNLYWISHEGRYLAGSIWIDFLLRKTIIWDSQTGKQIFNTDETASIVPDQLALSPDALTLAIGSSLDGVIELLNIQTGDRRAVYRTGALSDAAFLDNQSLIFAGGGQSVWKWNFTQTPEPVRAFSVDSTRFAGIIPGDNDTLWLDGIDDGVLLYDLATGQELLRFSDFSTRAIALSSDRNLLAYGDWVDWDASIPHENDEQCNPCGVLKLYDTEQHQPLDFAGHHGKSESIYHVGFNPSGGVVISGSEHEARIWDLDSGEMLSKLDDQGIFDVFYVGFSPDNQAVVGVADANAKILYMWEPAVWQTQKTLTPENARILLQPDSHWSKRISDVLLHPTEPLVFVAAPYMIRIFSTDTGEELHILEGHTGTISNLTLSDDRRFLVSTGLDGIIRIWGVTPTE